MDRWKVERMTWVADGVFAAGGEHIPKTWATFSQQTGIRAVLHLSPNQPQPFLGPPPSRYLWLDLEDESEADLTIRALTGDFILYCRTAGEGVLLHGAQGLHRVRWAFVAFQLRCGRNLETVLREAAEKPWLGPYHTDQALWQAYCDQCALNSSKPYIPFAKMGEE
jgi:hypothetical protein